MYQGPITALDPWFLKRQDDRHFRVIESLADADGIEFLCPVCFERNGGRVGTHRVICWSPKVPQSTSPTPGRWELLGTGWGDIELRAGSSSILLQDPNGCGAHFFIRNGQVTP